MTAEYSKSVVNLMWNRWSVAITQIANGQKQLESLYLKTLAHQKKIMDLYFKLVESYSKELQTIMEEIQARTYSTVDKIEDVRARQALQNIQKQLEEIYDQLASISITPQNAARQWVTENYRQIESNLHEFLLQQEKNSSEFKMMLTEFSTEMKEMIEKMVDNIEKLQNERLLVK